MIAYQSGELAAFERLYALLQADLRRYLAAAIREDSSAVQDLVQETFLEVHRSRRTYLPPLPVRPWLFGIARNVLGRHRRKAWRRARHEDRTIEPSDEQTWSTAPARSPAVEPLDIEDALRRLPAGRRDAWLLHHVHGFSFEQIAQRFRIGVGAAKLRSSRAMKTLRATLGIEPGGRDE
ncbi:MAG TPA: RNA polymerase sigma factor [Thermoanaerobaculia bacterium]|nr:RNA polymerase sigma factor [Thermoanaerobaculia bacterium]